ncbi:MBL fold metallo-hydrolase [Anabaena sp. CS-542/02]|uniref:MBL fold metallo-hydrolase n=1 Tax=Anabaena sp. CS-542/02 TaxID=3021719 RepID=UPI00232C2403|nr:MBL fold metallo-hydrolase [Anabaena sp. CS-542/02]MDB9447359.1 MBL fold metallo-hydrolase [Anabaena sp. CS-542/02]
MYLTWLDSNSWLLEIGNQRILLDPWLVGSLTFGNLDWFFKGSRTQERPIPQNIDLILLSQGLEDHAHPPTLKQLDHEIKVVGSANAAKLSRELGYNYVTSLKHGESFNLNEQVEITAVPGSVVGYNLVENGYLIKELTSGLTIYYEPHGSHSPEIKQFAPVDVVITPIVDITLPLGVPIIKGRKSALEVAQWLQPQIMLPTAAGGDVVFEGVLTKFLKAQGSVAEFNSLLQQYNLSTQVMELTPGDRRELQLTNNSTVSKSKL